MIDIEPDALPDGFYEQVIYRSLNHVLQTIQGRTIQKCPIDKDESARVLTNYASTLIERGLQHLQDKGKKIDVQVALINKVIEILREATGESFFDQWQVDACAQQLLSVLDARNTHFSASTQAHVIRPETSLAQSSLFTGAIHEPQMYSEISKEIATCDRIDMLVSFIKWSGLRLIIEDLRAFVARGGRLRVITTSYMGATDIKAVEQLRQLVNTELKVSYDTKRTRLHAKAYVFYRETGFTTAYIGSSNLSNVAISSGLEWNIKVTHKDQPSTLQKIEATFASYWNASEFETYTETQKVRLEKALRSEHYSDPSSAMTYLFDINPYPYQQEILDQLEAERTIRGSFRNLVVAATGTGKTVIAALDYRAFRKRDSRAPSRLLFIAHREEILRQSLACFRGVLKDPNFGELYAGGYQPASIDYLFTSVQTFHSQELSSRTSSDFYDYIIVDEFHHAAAPTYQKILSGYQPRILLGLTATPERMDGKSILEYFDNRVAAEIRLPEAIDRKLLCPFQYFGVSDTVDLADLKWTRGGYDRTELSRVYTLSGHVANRRAEWIVQSLDKYVTDLHDVRGLGFCVSVEHAHFMTEVFCRNGIPSLCLTGDSPEEERRSAKQQLISGEVRMIFVVDIYNEGVDIPEINTVLFLRPTESLTIFLQQLGRGLRLAENKECLTVLDFVGQANRKYNFYDRFAALLASTSRGVYREIKDGFVSLPRGCYIQLEKIAKEHILENIRQSFGQKNGFITRIASFEEDSGLPLNLANFLRFYHLDPRALYQRGSWSRLGVLAGVREEYSESIEDELTKAFPKICSMNARNWIEYLLRILDRRNVVDEAGWSVHERAMLRMFAYTVWPKKMNEMGDEALPSCLRELDLCPVMRSELQGLLAYQLERVDFVDEPIDLGFTCPINLHCAYSRDQLLLAMGFLSPNTIREGVKWLPEQRTDILLVTLNKSDKDYSPTTMYEDYSISEELFHWQSQSTTSDSSVTGQRYIHHREQGTQVLLFVREYRKDILGNAEPYTCLGLVDYVSYEGSMPMSITWRLRRPIPARFLRKTNKLVVG